MILSIFLVTTVMLVWFKTDAFVEYFGFLPISKEYKKMKESHPEIDFIMFLTMMHNNFFVRLISCQYCMVFWLSAIVSLFTNPIYTPVIYICALVLYKLI